MKRYLIFYKNGAIVQQDALHEIYIHLHSLGVLVLVIDAKEGTMIRGKEWEWQSIPEFSAQSLVGDVVNGKKVS